MILNKSLQLVLKTNNTSTFKTLENQLVAVHKGERTVVSQKTNEVEQLMPNLLGTSKAILNYVIFCHQDDSLWPIAEAAVLKKRFDEIFDSVKFIKVLDNFKAINKDMSVDIKLLNNNVGHLANDKKRATDKRKALEVVRKSVEECNADIERIGGELTQIDKESERLFNSNQDFEKVLNEYESLRQRLIHYREQEDMLKGSIEELAESDTELQQRLDNFTPYLEGKEQSKTENERECKDFENTLQSERDHYNTLVRTQGELDSLRVKYVEQAAIRDQLEVKYPDRPAGQTVESFLFDMKNSESTKLEALEDDRLTYICDAQRAIDMLRDQIATQSEQVRYLRSDIDSTTSKNMSIQRAIQGMEGDSARILVEKAHLEKAIEKLELAKRDNTTSKLTEEIFNKEQLIATMEHEIDILNKEITQASKHGAILAKVELLEEGIWDAETTLDALRGQTSERFAKITKASVEDSDFREKWDESFKKLIREKETLARSRDELRYERTKLEEKHKTLASNLETYTQKAAGSEKLVLKHISKDELPVFDEILSDKQAEYDEYLEVMECTKAAITINNAAIKKAQSEHQCPTCRRGFGNDSELEVSVRVLTKAVEGLKNVIKQSPLDDIKKELDDLKSISSDVAAVREINGTLDRMKGEVENAKSDLETHNRRISDLETKEIKLVEELIFDAESLRDPISQMSRLVQDMQAKQTELDSVKKQLQMSGQQTKTIGELETVRRTKTYNIKSLREELKGLADTKENAQNLHAVLEKEVSDKRLLISNLERMSMEAESLKRQLDENNQKIAECVKTVTESETKLDALEKELIQKRSDLSTYENTKDREVRVLKQSLEEWNHKWMQVKTLSEEMRVYEDEKEPLLSKCRNDMAKSKERQTQLERSLASGQQSIRAIELELMEATNIQRNIKLNLDLRSVRCTIKDMEQRLEGLDTQTATTKKDEYTKQSQALRQKYSDLKSKHSQKIGEVSQLKKNAQMLTDELQRDYSNIEDRHKEEYTKLQTKLLLSNDITIYSKALDSAVMKYHSLKMKEINKIIDELWKKTYSGTDVDTILIKSDMTSSQVKSAGRSYNYRVVMVKQDTELDMRGRCSAGQKVLASIIIRLALAESFGVNCGIIALDEPTTNLDEPNIESLARSLNQLIETRQQQNNFQLIVITHDEKFLTHMKAAQFTDHYYKVSRNERQKSEIGLIRINSS